MTFRVQPERERGLALAPGRSALLRRHGAEPGRSGNGNRSSRDHEHGRLGDRPLGQLVFRLEYLRGLIDDVLSRPRRVERRPSISACCECTGELTGVRPAWPLREGMLDDRLRRKRHALARSCRSWLGRLESHVVPAESSRLPPIWPKPCGPHGQAWQHPCGRAGRRRGKRKAWFRLHLRQPLTGRPPDGRSRRQDVNWLRQYPATRWARQRRYGGNSFQGGPRCSPRAQQPRMQNGLAGSTSMTVRPSIIEAAKSVRW